VVAVSLKKKKKKEKIERRKGRRENKDQNLIGFRQGNKNQKEGWL